MFPGKDYIIGLSTVLAILALFYFLVTHFQIWWTPLKSFITWNPLKSFFTWVVEEWQISTVLLAILMFFGLLITFFQKLLNQKDPVPLSWIMGDALKQWITMIMELGIFTLLAFLANWWWNQRNPAQPPLLNQLQPPLLNQLQPPLLNQLQPPLPNQPQASPTEIQLLERIATALETIAEKDSNQGILLMSLEKAFKSIPIRISKTLVIYGFLYVFNCGMQYLTKSRFKLSDLAEILEPFTYLKELIF